MEGSVDVMETALVDPARTGNLAASLDAAESQGENSQAAGATAPAADGSAPADPMAGGTADSDPMAGDPMAGDPMGDADYGTDYGDDNMDGIMGDDPWMSWTTWQKPPAPSWLSIRARKHPKAR